MTHHLGAAFNPDIVTAKFVLESGIAAFRDGALVVTNRIGWFEFLFFPTARIVVNQRHMVQAAAVFMQLDAAIGSIHDVIETVDAFRTDQRRSFVVTSWAGVVVLGKVIRRWVRKVRGTRLLGLRILLTRW